MISKQYQKMRDRLFVKYINIFQCTVQRNNKNKKEYIDIYCFHIFK